MRAVLTYWDHRNNGSRPPSKGKNHKQRKTPQKKKRRRRRRRRETDRPRSNSNNKQKTRRQNTTTTTTTCEMEEEQANTTTSSPSPSSSSSRLESKMEDMTLNVEEFVPDSTPLVTGKGDFDPRASLTPAQISALEQLRKKVQPDLNPEQTAWCTDMCFLRYLRARNWDLSKSEKMLRDTLK